MATGIFATDLGSIFDADIAADAAIARTKLAERTNAVFPILFSDWRVWDALAQPLPPDGTLESAQAHAGYFWDPTSADDTFFAAGRAYRVVGITARVEVAGTDGGAVTAVVRKAASGTDIAAGTALHTGTINLKGTVDTNQVLALSATSTDLDIAAGTAIGIDLTGTLTSARGTVTVLLAPAASPDDLRVVTGAFGSAASYIGTQDLKAAGASTRYARALVRVPPDWGTNLSLTLRAYAGMVTTIADASATIDMEVWRVDRDGTLGAADLVETAAQSINSTTAAAKDFVLTPTTISAGDTLDVRMTLALNDAATATAVRGAVWDVLLLADLK